MLVVPLAVVLLLLLLLANELGGRIGRARAHTMADQHRTFVVEMAVAMLAIASLLLGFSFSMAAQRFDERRLVIVDEANAIGTAFLRARMIPEPERSAIREELRAYVDAHVTLYEPRGNDRGRARAAGPSPEERVWMLASAVVERTPNSVPNALFVQSLNEMIDLETTRGMIFESHVPLVIAVLLAAVSLLSMLGVGYASGLHGRRNRFLAAILALSIAGTVLVIFDLDEPRLGLIRVSLKAMLDLRERISQVSQ